MEVDPSLYILNAQDTSTLSQWAWRDSTGDDTHSLCVSTKTKEMYEKDASKKWNFFYQANRTNFYMDRHYLHKVFPGIAPCNGKRSVLLECGCGVGNSVFPLLKTDPDLFVFAIDLSSEAIRLLKEKEEYLNCNNRCQAYVCDVTADPLPQQILSQPLDSVLMLYSLSAVNPEKMLIFVRKVVNVMKKGSLLFFRDYGRGDLAQLRFTEDGHHKIEDNFYVRQDGTRAYYFTTGEIERLFECAGLTRKELSYIDREQHNHAHGTTWTRRWIHAIFIKD
eukprot:g6369.t1